MIPMKIQGEIFFDVVKILPIPKHGDYYVNVMDKNILPRRTVINSPRRNLPKINDMIEWGVIKPGDVIIPKGRDGEGILQKNGKVMVNNKEMSLQKWLQEVFGWAHVQTYKFSIHKESGRSLREIRREYMEKAAIEAIDGEKDL